MAFGVVITVMLGLRTVTRNVDWLSEERLFLHDGKVATQSVMAQSNMAAILLLSKRNDEAKEILTRAEAIYPTYPELMNNWGMYYWWTGNEEEARVRFERCLEVHRGNVLCGSNLEGLKGVK